MYARYDSEERSKKLMYDFLYHFSVDISPIVKTDTSALQSIELMDDVDLNTDPRFTWHYKDVLCEIAANTLKLELEGILHDIRPKFNAETLSPDWVLPDLYTAMVYSIFMGDGSDYVYRVCANPYCNNLFNVVITNSKQKYCCDECRAKVAQRNRRARERIKKKAEGGDD